MEPGCTEVDKLSCIKDENVCIKESCLLIGMLMQCQFEIHPVNDSIDKEKL